MTLRPYQVEAVEAVLREWQTNLRTLLVLPTGCGKTIVFASICERLVADGARVLVLAHREELIRQAVDKIAKATGLSCAVEKAEEFAGSYCLERVVVGSVQTLLSQTRREALPAPTHIIVDEAHHVLSASYQTVLAHWPDAHVLGVTATPDRGDMRELGEFFQSLSYEYTLPDAIQQGHLCKIRALTIPLNIDLGKTELQAGDLSAQQVASAIEPYMEQIAAEMAKHCIGRKTLVFLPLISTSQKFVEWLNKAGLRAREVNGTSEDRAETLRDFGAGKFDVLCNAMLLTEGYDEPAIDCVVVLRQTRVRSLYAQMVGRGTRLSPGKEHLLILDFLWHCERHSLARPSSLIAIDEGVAAALTKRAESSAGGEGMVLDDAALTQARQDYAEERESALAKRLAELRHRKRDLVDPVQYAASIGRMDLADYAAPIGDGAKPPTCEQVEALAKAGIQPAEITSRAQAQAVLTPAESRQQGYLAQPRQIRILERYGFEHVGRWSFDAAQREIRKLAASGWRRRG
jgi:superfamily II DNA or RNA helicase